MKTSRNAPCPCGSGKKYKQCCINVRPAMPVGYKVFVVLLGLLVVAGLALTVSAFREGGSDSDLVWSEEHQHFHKEP